MKHTNSYSPELRERAVRRILEPIGNRPPVAAEAAYYQQTEHTALDA